MLALQLTTTLQEAEQTGVKFVQNINAGSLAALRAMPAHQLLEETKKPNMPCFCPIVDSYFSP